MTGTPEAVHQTMSNAYDDAQRYLDNRRVYGWNDPTIDPLDVIEELLTEWDNITAGMDKEVEERDEKIADLEKQVSGRDITAEKIADALEDSSDLADRFLDLESATVEDLIAALQVVAERERNQAATRRREINALEGEKAKLVAERDLLRKQVTAMFQGAPAPEPETTKKPRATRKPRAAGAGKAT